MNCPAPAPGSAQRLAELDLKNFLSEGYSDDEVTAVLGPVTEATGVHVICLWDYVDRYGCGGESEWYVISWINYGEGEPGDPDTWIGNSTGVSSSTLTAVDSYNYARRQY